MKNRFLLGAGVALAMAFGGVQAHAQFLGPYPPGAFYLGPEGGWTKLFSQSPGIAVTGPSGAVASIKPTVNWDSGFNAGVRGGYVWGPWRFEEEYSYRYNSVSNTNSSLISPHGSAHSNAIMTNVLYDFTLGWPVTPHIGGGVGALDVYRALGGTATITTNNATSVNGPTTYTAPNGTIVNVPAGTNHVVPAGSTLTFTSPAFSGSKWNFGYQGIAGIRYLINPALAFDVDYRYLATTNQSTSGAHVTTPTGCCVFSNVKKLRYQSNNVVASLTMMFGAPPPAAPPPAPPAPPPPPTHQVYLVFFDWDKYNITPEGMQILEAAAAHWKAGASVQIQVTGYTDLSGSAGYNQRLSERRASAVATALVRLGIPRNEMVVAGRGMNDPRVPTPLGVREPQNRRVEIVFP
ncbi:MAG: OmpA family protein [Alphaproteobacteria bacterium]|nr:OmpA family protein [Alphaproteobacteria bacterium]